MSEILDKQCNVMNKFRFILQLIDKGEIVSNDEIGKQIENDGLFNFLEKLNHNPNMDHPLTENEWDKDLTEEILGFDYEHDFFSLYENGLISLSYLLWEINNKYSYKFLTQNQ